MINLEVLGNCEVQIAGARLKPLLENVNVRYHPVTYEMAGPKGIKRVYLRRKAWKNIQNVEKDSIWLYSQPPTIMNRVLIGLAKNNKTILDCRDIYQEWNYHPRFKRLVEIWEQKTTMKAVDLITYAHVGFRSFLEQDVNNSQKLKFVSNGFDGEIFHYNDSGERLGNPAFVYCGSIGSVNNILFLLKIIRRIQRLNPKAHFTFVGTGISAKKVIAYIRSGVVNNITLETQWVPQERLAHIYNRTDYALSSVAPAIGVYYNICIPNKIFEALGCGVPIVAFNGEAVREFLSNYSMCKVYDVQKQTIDEISFDMAHLPPVPTNEKKWNSALAIGSKSYYILRQQFEKLLYNLAKGDLNA